MGMWVTYENHTVSTNEQHLQITLVHLEAQLASAPGCPSPAHPGGKRLPIFRHIDNMYQFLSLRQHDVHVRIVRLAMLSADCTDRGLYRWLTCSTPETVLSPRSLMSTRLK